MDATGADLGVCADLDAFNGDLNAAVGSYMEGQGHQQSTPAGGNLAGAAGAPVEGVHFATMYNEKYGLLHPKVNKTSILTESLAVSCCFWNDTVALTLTLMVLCQFWNDDYDSAVRGARCEGKMVLVYFHDQHEVHSNTTP